MLNEHLIKKLLKEKLIGRSPGNRSSSQGLPPLKESTLKAISVMLRSQTKTNQKGFLRLESFELSKLLFSFFSKESLHCTMIVESREAVRY